MVYHSRLPSWPRNCLQDPYFGPYRIIRIDGSRIHVRCSPRLGGELLCAPKQLRHYHSPDDLSWDEWRLGDSEVERIDLENAASPEEADELEEMTADEMAVDGYYVVAGIARHEYKQGWKFLTLWDGYGYLRRPGNLCQPSYLGGSRCMVKNEGKGRKMTGFQRHQKIFVLMDFLEPSQTSMAE